MVPLKGKGSGRLPALVLAENGVIVAAKDISAVNMEEVVDQIAANGGQARG